MDIENLDGIITAAAAEITPVIEVDNRKIGSDKPGRITLALQWVHRDIASGKDSKYLRCLTFVD